MYVWLLNFPDIEYSLEPSFIDLSTFTIHVRVHVHDCLYQLYKAKLAVIVFTYMYSIVHHILVLHR